MAKSLGLPATTGVAVPSRELAREGRGRAERGGGALRWRPRRAPPGEPGPPVPNPRGPLCHIGYVRWLGAGARCSFPWQKIEKGKKERREHKGALPIICQIKLRPSRSERLGQRNEILDVGLRGASGPRQKGARRSEDEAGAPSDFLERGKRSLGTRSLVRTLSSQAAGGGTGHGELRATYAIEERGLREGWGALRGAAVGDVAEH